MSLGLDLYPMSKRILLVYAASSDDGRYVDQIERLERSCLEASARDLVVVDVRGRGLSVPESAELAPPWAGGAMDGLSATGFSLRLVERDGRVVLKSSRPLDVQEIFDLIDFMEARARLGAAPPEAS